MPKKSTIPAVTHKINRREHSNARARLQQKGGKIMQAKKGGETGINGEEYKGGQFLPNHKDTIKGAKKRPQSKGRQPIAPFKWEAVPSSNHFAIFKLIESYITWIVFGETCKADQQEIARFKLEPGIVPSFGFRINAEEMIQRFNAGERWADMSETELYEPKSI